MKRDLLSIVACGILLAMVSMVGGQPAPDSDLGMVEEMDHQVLSLYRQGQYQQALTLANQALKFSEDNLGPEHPATADCLNDLGGMYQSLGRYTNAEVMFKRGLEIREKVLGPEHQYTARNLNNLGVLYTQMGRYAEAEPLLQRALAINDKVLGPESRASAVALASLGNLYQSMGDYNRALDFDERVLTLAEKILGPDSTETATAQNNLAMIDIYMGDLGKAEPLLQNVLAIYEKVLGPDHPNTGRAMQALAELYSRMGDFAKSEALFQRALAVLEVNPGPEHPDTARALSGLGTVYMNMGDYDKALPLILRALNIVEKVYGPEHPALANILGTLSALYEHLGDAAMVDQLDRRVLSIDEKSLGTNHPDTAVALMNLGVFHERLGELSVAKSFDEQALAIQEKVLGPDHPDLSANLSNLGSVYVRMGDYSNGISMMQRSVGIDEDSLGPDHPTTALHLENLATAYFDLQQTNDVLQYADRAEQSHLDLLDNILSFTSEQERLAYEAQGNPYLLYSGLDDGPRMALTILRHKGVVLDSLLEDQVVARAGENPDDLALIEQLGPAKRQLTEMLMTVPKDLKPETLKNRADARDKLSRQVEELQGALAQKVAGFGHARRALTVTVPQVQNAIPLHAVLLEYIQYTQYLGDHKWEKRCGAVVLAADGPPKWVCLGAATNIINNVVLYQEAVRDKAQKDAAPLSAALHRLYQQVWQPLAEQFPPDTKTVIISPDAALNFISFATLLAPDDHFLAEKYSVRYVASGRDLLLEPAPPAGLDMAVFAAPDYMPGGQVDSSSAGLLLPPLPYFSKNADDIAAQARSWNWPVQVYSGAAATETQVRKLHSPHILHFATHGFFLPDAIKGPDHFSFFGFSLDSGEARTQVLLKNPMSRSGIALAGAQVTLDAWERGEIPPTETDGILTAEEAGSLDLHGTWLVVLSACDTGIGEQRFGEGVMGLRRGFVQAGAQNLLMTLWPVFDVPSGELMVNFYSKLHEDNNPPQALAEVQRDWLVKLRAQSGLLPAVVMAGAFIMSSQGPVQ